MEPDELSREVLGAARKAIEAALAAGRGAVFFGGIAVNLRGRRRFTDDVDLIVDVDDAALPRLLAEICARGGTVPEGALERLRRDAMLPVRFGEVRVDLLLPVDPLTASVFAGATPSTAFDLPVGVARAEDLIAMKLLANRAQDIADVQALLVANRGALDFDRIRRWLPELAAYVPGVGERFEALKREFHDPLV